MRKKVKQLLNQDFAAAKKYEKLTPDKAIKIYREFNELTQLELAKLSGLIQTNIFLSKNDRITLGIERAKA